MLNSYRNITKTVIGYSITFIFSSGIAVGQAIEKRPLLDAVPTSCAIIRTQMERSMIEFAKNGDPAARNKYLLIIVRAGRGEKDGRLSRDRIRALKAYFDQRKVNQNVIFAEAAQYKDSLGIGEIFVDGVLTERFYFKPNKWKLCDSVEESW